jgi:hypothetical protein
MATTAVAAVDSVSDEQAVRMVVADYGDAWNRHDPNAILALFTDDADWVNVAGSLWHGQAEHRRGTTWVMTASLTFCSSADKKRAALNALIYRKGSPPRRKAARLIGKL